MGRGRAGAWTAAVLLALLALLPLGDLANAHVPRTPDAKADPDSWWLFATPQRARGDFLRVLAALPDRPHWRGIYQAYAVGIGVRRASGGRVGSLVVPSETAWLSNPPTPGGRLPRPVLDRGELARWTAGNLRAQPYDPALTGEQMRRLAEAGTGTRYPFGVTVVPGESDRWVLHTDPKRNRILVVPEALSPVGRDR